MVRAESEDTAFIALPLKEEVGAKALAEATTARKATKVFMFVGF
jgi:hypothetical protein